MNHKIGQRWKCIYNNANKGMILEILGIEEKNQYWVRCHCVVRYGALLEKGYKGNWSFDNKDYLDIWTYLEGQDSPE